MSGTRVTLGTLGCKLNQAETESLARQLAAAGYELVDSVDEADVYILNTCTVTHIADRKSRNLLRQAHRRNSHIRLIAIGCYAERSHQELARIEGVDLVLGNDQKTQILSRLQALGCFSSSSSASQSMYDYGRNRSFVKIQDGCDNFCSYCIVPLVRSRVESVSVEKVVAEVKNLAADGVKEVVLTGTEIGAYHSHGADLTGLLKRILAETGVIRLRLSSLQPQEIITELLEIWKDRRLCPHFHLSLQSGSDSVLRRMKRRYTLADYGRAVTLIRKAVPDAAITTDVIAGFPGETEAEFEESYDSYRQTGFARIHVFPYSRRPGTEAAEMPGQVSDRVKRGRVQQMLALAEESASSFRQCFLGKTMPVLWEKKSGGVWSGYTGNYIKVYARSRRDLANQLMPVKLASIYKDGVWGIWSNL
ncbi:MAG TPA: tRNA (N(6)-L-threonylcarbamoyladenosine(37)-C(2))-methylthiotransferase MtaB [Dehalococcoidales bacterium]|nr:tRNA (N(6)-L-threonylcarbamoyladenosine(37)-C(2))-methylthiotransferase MtaB [Dehalococcoidales bacterium]